MQGSLDLIDLIRLLIKKFWIIVLVSAIGLLGAFGFTKLFITPKYTSSVQLYVSNAKIIDTQDRINYNDITASQKLVSTYGVIIRSNQVLSQVIASESLQYTTDRLKRMLSVRSVDGTEIMEILVTTDNPQLSAKIANAIAQIAPESIKKITKAGTVEVVDQAVPNLNPSSPNTMMNSLIGFLLGAFIAVLYIILKDMMDTHIKGEDDIRKHYDIPILGSIPVLDSQMKGDIRHEH